MITTSEIEIPLGKVALGGTLNLPEQACGIVLFAHGSGSSRHSPRNRFVAQTLNEALGSRVMDAAKTMAEGGKEVVGALDQRIADVTAVINGRGAELTESISARIGDIDRTLGAKIAHIDRTLGARIENIDGALAGLSPGRWCIRSARSASPRRSRCGP